MDIQSTNQRPGFYFLICPDSFIVKKQIDTIVSSYLKNANQWKKHSFWGDEEPPKHFWDLLNLQGFFNSNNLIIIRQAHLWAQSTWKQLSQNLSKPIESCWLFLCLEGNWEKGKPKIPAHFNKLGCFNFAKDKNWIWQNEGITEKNIRSYINKRSKELNISFEADALNQFCVSIPPHAQAIECELQKFTVLKPQTPINIEMTATSSWTAECNIFACIKNMENGNLANVWKELCKSNDADSLIFQLMALLAREIRQLWQLLIGEKVQIFPSELNAKKALAKKLGKHSLAKAMSLIATSEYIIKSGQRSPEQTLENLATEMTLLFLK